MRDLLLPAVKWVARRVGWRPVWFALRWKLGQLTALWAVVFLGTRGSWNAACAVAWPAAGWVWAVSENQRRRRPVLLEAARWSTAVHAANAWPKLKPDQPTPPGGLRLPRLTHIQVSHGGNVNALAALPPGMSYDELEKLAPHIASWYRPPVLDLRVQRSDDVRHAEIVVTRWRAFDRHTDPFPYTPGAGIAVPERGGRFDVRYPGEHVLIAGQSGAGKSSWVNVIIAEALHAEHRPVLWGIDFKRVELGPWAPVFDRIALEPGNADQLLDDLIVEVDRRSHALEGHARKWTPGCGFAPLLLVVDELAQVCYLPWPGEDKQAPAQRLAKLARIGSMGRALGIQMVVATQNPLAEIVGRIRDNMQLTVCNWVRGEAEAGVALGSKDLAAQLRPQDLTLPGVAWVVGRDRKPFVARARFLDDGDVDQLAAAHALARPSSPTGPKAAGTPASQGARPGGAPSATARTANHLGS